jgi:DNA-binding transcriptional regulator YdaS (Cro superfamily)
MSDKAQRIESRTGQISPEEIAIAQAMMAHQREEGTDHVASTIGQPQERAITGAISMDDVREALKKPHDQDSNDAPAKS